MCCVMLKTTNTCFIFLPFWCAQISWWGTKDFQKDKKEEESFEDQEEGWEKMKAGARKKEGATRWSLWVCVITGPRRKTAEQWPPVCTCLCVCVAYNKRAYSSPPPFLLGSSLFSCPAVVAPSFLLCSPRRWSEKAGPEMKGRGDKGR